MKVGLYTKVKFMGTYMYCYSTDELSSAVAFMLFTIPVAISPSCKYELLW